MKWRVFLDAERSLASYQVENAELRIREIIETHDMLEHNPIIGRPAANGKGELVTGCRSHSYVALHRNVVEVDVVFVLALDSQQEIGYAKWALTIKGSS
jgi:hypothetical protein